jgi:polysaccharide export outer membrane protein
MRSLARFQIAKGLPRRLTAVLTLLFVPLLLASCTGSRGGNIPYAAEGFGQPDLPSIATLASDYRIAPNDKIVVSVFQAEKLSGEYKVDLTGHIAMPLVGNVLAAQKTPLELQSHLAQLLEQKLLKNPDVTVGIAEAGGSMVTIDGSVKGPGMFPVFGKTSLIQAIAMAKGLDQYANPKRIAIFRQIDGKRTAAAFDLTTIRDGEEPDPDVYRGDIIIVDGSKTKEALRDMVSAVPIMGMFRPLGF